MALTILGQNNMVLYRGTKWWAESGLVCWEEQLTRVVGRKEGAYGTMTVRDCLMRLRGLGDMVRNSKATKQNVVAVDEDPLGLVRYIEEMLEVCKRAQEQGCPDDPEAMKQLLEQKKKVHVVMPTKLSSF